MNIAIVDDEEMWRKLATTVVKKNGDDKNKIDTYNSGIDFLDKNKYYDNCNYGCGYATVEWV